MPNIAFVNGRFLPLRRAKVSVEDRGFQFGDGVYELIRAYGGRLFHPESHLERLRESAAILSLSDPYAPGRWLTILKEALKRSGYREAKIYIQLTRGTAPRNHPFPSRARPTVVVTVRRLIPLSASVRSRGVSIVTTPDIRWGRCDAKSVNLIANVLAKQQAIEAGAFEAVFVADTGDVTEGSGSNVFIVKDGRVRTPVKGSRILSGITRERVIGLAKSEGVEVIEESVTPGDLVAADEVFLTSTSLEVLGVVKVDGRKVGSGRPGPLTRTLAERFTELTRG